MWLTWRLAHLTVLLLALIEYSSALLWQEPIEFDYRYDRTVVDEPLGFLAREGQALRQTGRGIYANISRLAQNLKARAYHTNLTQVVQNLSLSLADFGPASRRREESSSDDLSDLAPNNWFWSNKQNTTRLLLFTEAGGDDNATSIFDKNSPLSAYKDSDFDPSKPTLLIIHGFRGSSMAHQSWSIRLKDRALSRRRFNVFYADWSHHARVINYYHALESMPEIAQDLILILSQLNQAYPKFDMTAIHVIGHSLGAHIAGILGRALNGEIRQITALDPAGVNLRSALPEAKLSKDDAKYVIAYHTDTKYYGTDMRLADRDIFFNGGDYQPACTGLIQNNCRHRQACKYISAFMGRCVMVAYECSSYENFLHGECGFCSKDSPDKCVAVGQDWQYDSGQLETKALTPKGFDKRKSRRDQEWISEGPRYYVQAGPEAPYCMFTYQVVVKLAENWPANRLLLNKSGHLRVSLSGPGVNGRATFQVGHRLSPTARVQVFTASNGLADWRRWFTFSKAQKPGDLEQISGGLNVFTKLLYFKHSTPKMPLKFTKADIHYTLAGRSNTSSRSDSDGSSVEPADEQLMSELQAAIERSELRVFVNFMSHIDYEQRRALSGPVEVSLVPASEPMAASANSKDADDISRLGLDKHQRAAGRRLSMRPPRLW